MALLVETMLDDCHIVAGALQRNVRLQARHNLVHGVRAIIGEHKRLPEARLVREPEVGRHHAHDRETRPVQGNRFPHNCRVRTKSSFPELTAENHDVSMLWVFLFGKERAPEHGDHAQQMEEIWTDRRSEKTFRFPEPCQVGGHPMKCRHVLEDLVLGSPLNVVRITDATRRGRPKCRAGPPEGD